MGQDNIQAPDLGFNFSHSGVLAALMVTNKFSAFEGHAHYKLKDGLEVVVNAKQDKKGVSGAAGVVYKVNAETTIKAKVDDKGGLETVTKFSPSKGLTFLLAGKYKDGKPGYGLSVNIE